MMTRVPFDAPLPDTYDDDPPKFSKNNAMEILVSKLSTERDPNAMLHLIEELIHMADDERELVKNLATRWTRKSGD